MNDGLSRVTRVVKLPDGLFMTKCSACKRGHWTRLRSQVAESEFDSPVVRFGTKPEANDYLRAHERTAYHALCLAREGTVSPLSKEEQLLREIFGEKATEGMQICPTCGGSHRRFVDCDGSPIGR